MGRISLFLSFNRPGIRLRAENWPETGAPSASPVPSTPRLWVCFFEKLNLNFFQDGYDLFSLFIVHEFLLLDSISAVKFDSISRWPDSMSANLFLNEGCFILEF